MDGGGTADRGGGLFPKSFDQTMGTFILEKFVQLKLTTVMRYLNIIM